MIGIIPSASSTYEVEGSFDTENPIAGKIYYNKDNRIYYYSTTDKRSNPKTGYFPIWDGKKTYVSSFSNEKYFDKDVVFPDVNALAKTIDTKMASKIMYRQRLSESNAKLKPVITDEDNMFTQVIKGTICNLDITKVDLGDWTAGTIITPKLVDNYYASLSKVTMMRMERFHVWMDLILHLHYIIRIFKNNKKVIEYKWPEDKFETGIVRYDDIVKRDDDPLKKLVKIIMVKENINKADLRTEEVDDYTVNNMITTIHGTKPLSAQIFCRFMRLTSLTFSLSVYDKKNKLIFEYKE